ncbi:hypothetical protein ATK30_1680 [Amycolatopsis echigonensis]|uniref:Uncharacterized protein n=1 Tax=Amycolatopsis echigonensis TaxID=2576905 RepID=A0A2N3WAL4_9PSEU|nr:hypothetical protein ATK30_1680 [Amycolatopsis niigatensis]
MWGEVWVPRCVGCVGCGVVMGARVVRVVAWGFAGAGLAPNAALGARVRPGWAVKGLLGESNSVKDLFTACGGP